MDQVVYSKQITDTYKNKNRAALIDPEKSIYQRESQKDYDDEKNLIILKSEYVGGVEQV